MVDAGRAGPDWRDASAYEYTKDLSLDLWAWEFLRRNPGYREAYLRELEKIRWSEQSPKPDRFPGREVRPDEPGFCSYSRDARENWSILGYCNPETGNPTRLQFVGPGWLYRHGELASEDGHLFTSGEFPLPSAKRESVYLALIDLGTSIQPQVERVRRSALAHQKRLDITPKRLKREQKNWCLYLRALDGDANDARRDELSFALYPLDDQDNPPDPKKELQWIDEILKVARKLRDGGYRSIVGLP